MTEMENSATQNSLMHDLALGQVSVSLKGKRIAMCCCGGIAAIESPKIARALRRLGADVEAWATEAALRFVGRESLEWATSAQVVTLPSGMAEHISTHDCILICNATADVLAKAAQGLCSDGVSTLIQSAMGLKIPVVFMQTMHESLARSPLVERNCEILKTFANVTFLNPRREESKYKVRPPDEMADEVSHIVNKQRIAPATQKVLVTLGGTRVAIDSVRSISNRSSGRFGLELMRELYRNGFDVNLIAGEITVDLPQLDQMTLRQTPYYDDMYAAVKELKASDYSGVFMLAAVSDFVTEKNNTQQEKVSSQREVLNLNLVRSKKIVALDSFQSIPFRFTCKLTQDDGKEAQSALERHIQISKPHYVFWNTVAQAFGEEQLMIGKLLKTFGKDRAAHSQANDYLKTAAPFATKRALSQHIVSLFSKHLETEK